MTECIKNQQTKQQCSHHIPNAPKNIKRSIENSLNRNGWDRSAYP